jgi:hypothetical protein
MKIICSAVFLLSAFLSANAHEGFVLMTSLYDEKSPVRAHEYRVCMEINCANPDIHVIHVMYDTSDLDAQNWQIPEWLYHPKITIEYCTGRPSFGYMFKQAASLYEHRLILVSNADIYFNETLTKLYEIDFTNLFLAFTRWDVLVDGKLQIFTGRCKHNGKYCYQARSDSQDTWIFRSPLVGVAADTIYVGIPHCDNYLAYQALCAGYDVYNPVFDIQCCHLHISNIRHYSDMSPPDRGIALLPGCCLAHIRHADYKPSVDTKSRN